MLFDSRNGSKPLQPLSSTLAATQPRENSHSLLFLPDVSSEPERRIFKKIIARNWEEAPFFINNLEHVQEAAEAVALGRPLIVLAPFGNIYGLFGHPSKEVVSAVNVAKGRPADQVGSITTTEEYILKMFDLKTLPEGLDQNKIKSLIDAFNMLGPIGFVGPAAAHIPDHLVSTVTRENQSLRVVQVITPGYNAPFNDFLRAVINHMGTDPNYLFATSANLSHHVTGQEEPAHFRRKPLQQEFKGTNGVIMLAHPNENAMGVDYSAHEQSSTSIIRLDSLSPEGALIVRRHGSLAINKINEISQEAVGLPAVLAEEGLSRAPVRQYDSKTSRFFRSLSLSVRL